MYRLALVSLLALGCGSTPVERWVSETEGRPVYEGEPDPLAVVALELVPGQIACSAVRVAPTTLLTANHCLATAWGIPEVVTVDGLRERPTVVASAPEYDAAVLSVQTPGPYVETAIWRGNGPFRVVWHYPVPWDQQEVALDDQNGNYFAVMTECVHGTSGSPVFEGGRLIGITHATREGNTCWAERVSSVPIWADL